MASLSKTITPCLWFDARAEEAAKLYCSIFKNSKITQASRYPEAGQEIHKKPAGSVTVVAFELDGQHRTQRPSEFQIRRGGSFQVMCDTQDEIDYYRSRLTAARKAPAAGEGQIRPVLAGGAERHSAHDERS